MTPEPTDTKVETEDPRAPLEAATEVFDGFPGVGGIVASRARKVPLLDGVRRRVRRRATIARSP